MGEFMKYDYLKTGTEAVGKSRSGIWSAGNGTHLPADLRRIFPVGLLFRILLPILLSAHLIIGTVLPDITGIFQISS